MKWFMETMKNAFNFSDRSRRKEYWMFYLIATLIMIVLTLVDVVAGLEVAEDVGILSTLFSLILIIPSLAVTFRRLHDTGKSGWWILISLIPIIGWIVLLIFTVQDSETGINSYGANPKLAV
ncbi:MAG TPA: DUF805 domain-containing protein [Planococcus sp. (in: firmicutes)]|nr:DUF805 domain-containing protein [Planococcus sp. (in: firmicutes)]